MMYFKNITNEKQMKGGMICGSKNVSVGDFCILQPGGDEGGTRPLWCDDTVGGAGNARGSILAPRPAVAY